jgi:hypothetical protein
MASGIIKLEIDEESYEQTRIKLLGLYKLADEASRRIEHAQQSVQRIGGWFAFLSFCVGVGSGWLMCLVHLAKR